MFTYCTQEGLLVDLVEYDSLLLLCCATWDVPCLILFLRSDSLISESGPYEDSGVIRNALTLIYSSIVARYNHK